MFKHKLLIIIGLLTLGLLAGCGEKKELTEFKENMSLFYTQITAIGESLNGITAQSEDAVASLLDNLDAMEEQFKFLAEIEVPAEFSNVEALADDASMHMAEAVNYYHQAYADGAYNENLLYAAAQHYESAMKRVNYIASLLQGEIPEGAEIIVTEGEDNEFEPYSEASQE
ncbi:MAG: hypothetical protein PUI46_08985 [Lachnospiraceae bacterium]|nr:hypothetical protein [Lachnospiraceae bacterium]MDY5700623.1 hypothetical protein [Lachnospiraceae bacterium]